MIDIRYTQRLKIFEAQTANARELQLTWKNLNRQINASILSGDERSTKTLTRLLAVVYCAMAEVYFSKVIHIPYGLNLDHMEQIKVAGKNNTVNGWKKCVELALRNVEGKSNYAPNVKKKLDFLIDRYIFDPSLIRNKLAHGQWATALNRENTATNSDITSEIADLCVVELYRRKAALEKMADILEDLISSPRKAQPRDYWSHITALEKDQEVMSAWTFQKKVDDLFKKRSYAKKAI